MKIGALYFEQLKQTWLLLPKHENFRGRLIVRGPHGFLIYFFADMRSDSRWA